MTESKQLHEKAMAAFQEALVSRHLGREDEALTQYERALELERAAAMRFVNEGGTEPTRAILFRSAATLAMDCGKYGEARELIRLGLSGSPSTEILFELKQMDEDALAKLAHVPNVLASYLEQVESEKMVLSDLELDQLIGMMGKLSPSEMNVIRNEHSLVERLMNALAKYLLRRATIHQVSNGDLPVTG
jgi:tetratricopeptide (TPR) repeat protein